MSTIMSIHTAKAPSVERLEVEQDTQSREESFCFRDPVPHLLSVID